ncbi:hypothetical protein [Daejeonella lutea]|uniref:Uncharacterized protein n=1 Tax=Daejeonella lutea TaxID=572036 RepID=A0A1T4ZWN2_9SPHI|nr:hypothetical protein [Daejeonella lutea]SKB27128.1 hypothetical protein SAMN05661099_0019 [Daejeonella lutea]
MIRLTLIACFISSVCFSQTNELYTLAFKKKENFKILSAFNQRIPETFEVINTTEKWNPQTFFLKDLDLRNPKVIDSLKYEEHHPYLFAYLFSNPKLDALIPDAEKERLSKRASQIKPSKIAFKGNGFQLVERFNKPLGFYFLIASPVYSTDNRYAFLKISVKEKRVFLDEKMDDYYAILTIMFEKDLNGKWKQIGIKDHLIL